MTRFFKGWKCWLKNLFFGPRRRQEALLTRIAESIRAIEIDAETNSEFLRKIMGDAEKSLRDGSICLSAATQALVRAQGVFERSDATFEKIGALADKMKDREAALENLLIADGTLKIQTAKKVEVEVEELKKDQAARVYDEKF